MTFDFSEALQRLKQGEHVTRSFWTLEEQWIELLTLPVRSDVRLTVTSPFYMHSIQFNATERTLAPWLPTVMDLMAEDWSVWEPSEVEPSTVEFPTVTDPATATPAPAV